MRFESSSESHFNGPLLHVIVHDYPTTQLVAQRVKYMTIIFVIKKLLLDVHELWPLFKFYLHNSYSDHHQMSTTYVEQHLICHIIVAIISGKTWSHANISLGGKVTFFWYRYHFAFKLNLQGNWKDIFLGWFQDRPTSTESIQVSLEERLVLILWNSGELR